MKEIKNNTYLLNTNLEKDTKLAEVSPLVLVPLLNKQIEKVNSSTVNSLVKHNIQEKETLEDNKKGYKYRSQISIDQNNKIINYLQDNNLRNNLSDKIQKLLSIKNNNESFLKDNNASKSTYYLEDILKLIILNIKDNNKKDTANNLLKKLNLLKKSFKNKNKTPILSSYLKQIIPLFINNLANEAKINNSNNNSHNEEKYNKELIEYNFKVKYVNPIEEYKDRNSLLYKNLPVEDKKLINTLLFIESKPLNKELNTINNKNLLMTKQNLIRTISPFNSELLYSKNIMFNFNKRNNYNILINEKNIFSILEGSFLSMDSLISKAIFTVKPNNILINLFFF